MELAGWIIDEAAHAGREHLDPRYVEAYDSKARFDATAALEILVDTGLGPKSVLLDFGAGTGEMSLAAAGVARRVIAVDVSEAMLAALERKAALRGVGNVEVVRAGFLSYEHGADQADFVYTRNALHHLPDFWKAVALKRLSTFLRPRGVLRLQDLVFSFELGDVDAAVGAWLDTAADRPEAGWTRHELEVHLREEHSTFTWILEPMLTRAGFEIADASYSDSRTYAAYTCIRR